jgi:hypothetical protein
MPRRAALIPRTSDGYAPSRVSFEQMKAALSFFSIGSAPLERLSRSPKMKRLFLYNSIIKQSGMLLETQQ